MEKTEKGTQALPEMSVRFIFSPSCLACCRSPVVVHTETSRQFCSSSSENCFRLDKTPVALQPSTRKPPVLDFYFRSYLSLSTGNSAALAPAVSAAWSCRDDPIALCLDSISCACKLVYTHLKGFRVDRKNAYRFMSRRATRLLGFHFFLSLIFFFLKLSFP